MDWKKNAFSYILWLAYTVAVSIGATGIIESICEMAGFSREYGIFITMGCLVVAYGIVFGLRSFWTKSDMTARLDNHMAIRVAEWIYVVVIMGVGLMARLTKLSAAVETVDGYVYYELAMYGQDNGVLCMTHGATSLYIQALRLAFLLFGNALSTAIGLQILLQMLAGIVLYFAVRRLAGNVAAILTMAFLMLSPYIIGEVLRLSPAFLLLLLYSLALLYGGYILPRNKGSLLWYVGFGLLAGIVSYLDVFGVTLFLVLAGVFTVKRRRHIQFRNSRIAVFLFGIVSGVYGFMGTVVVDSLASGREFLNLLFSWFEIHRPQNFKLISITETGDSFADAAILFLILLIGIFSFWCRKNNERQGIWILVTIALAALQSFKMVVPYTGSEVYIYIFLAVLAGISVESIFIIDDSADAEEEADAAVINEINDKTVSDKENSDKVIAGGAITDKVIGRPTRRTAVNAATIKEETVKAEDIKEEKRDEDAPSEAGSRKVKFLENPLPLPKKHERRTMDYPINEITAEMDFDLAIDDNDDFDI